MADDVDIKALIKEALSGISDGPDARKQRRIALQNLAHDEKGAKLRTLENATISKIVKSFTIIPASPTCRLLLNKVASLSILS